MPANEVGRTLLTRTLDGVLPPDLRASIEGRLRLDATWHGFPKAEIREMPAVAHYELDESGNPIIGPAENIRYYHHTLGWFATLPNRDKEEAADDDAQPERFNLHESFAEYYRERLAEMEASEERFLERLNQLQEQAQGGPVNFKLRRYCDLETHEDCEGGCWLDA